MFESIISNMQWVFSGIGVLVVSLFFALPRKGKKDDAEYHKVDIQVSHNSVPPQKLINSSELKTETQKISERLYKTLELMNEGGTEHSPLTIAKLAKNMGLQSVSSLENIFTGKEEPTFQFLTDFCQTFGVNEEWLTEGKNYPFHNDSPHKSNPLDYFEYIQKINPKAIYFIRANTDISQAFVMLQLSNLKFQILKQDWHISDHIGGAGEWQLVNFYRLIRKLKDHGFATKGSGRTLEEEAYYSLYMGKEFPTKFVGMRFSNDTWWDDFTDVYNKYFTAECYTQAYGNSFVKAQKIIQYNLDHNELYKAQ